MRAHHVAMGMLGWLVLASGCTCSGDTTEPGLAPNGDSGLDGTKTDGTPPTCNADAGEQACGDKCVDVTKDLANCGACGRACGAGALCCASQCIETAACTFAVTSVEPNKAWQNGGEWVKLAGAGFAKGMRVFIGSARAPVRVIDPKNAILETPPGPLGTHDLKIVLGGSTATWKDGFRYVANGLATPWQQKPLAQKRGEWPAVAVMQDGRVLVAGGSLVADDHDQALDTAEIFTRKADGKDTLVPTASKMSVKRWRATGVTLLDGRVLVVGGACPANDVDAPCTGDPKSADLFDPATDSFKPLKALAKPRVHPRAVLMADGRVLIASATDPSFEIFDPETDTFTLVPHDPLHAAGFLVRLRDGNLLIGGGIDPTTGVSADLLDADDPSKSTKLPPLSTQRWLGTAHVLPDGRVFVIGGGVGNYSGWKPQTSIEAYDPATKTFSTLPYKLGTGRGCHASALVRDGSILVMGGYVGDPSSMATCAVFADSVDQIDPVKGTVSIFATLPNKNTEWKAVTLLDGSVLGVGGGACGSGTALPDLDFLPGAPGPK